MSRSLALVLAGLAAAACSSAAPPDAATSAWSLGPAVPRRALEPGVAALGLRLVVIGGFATGPGEGAEITARVDAFDTTTGVWTRLPDAPVRWTEVNLAAIGDTLYLAGGLEGAPRAAHGELFALDPVDHLWHALPAMPAGQERGGAGVVTASGHLYLLGGASSTAALATCLDYDVVARTWTPLPPLPEPRAHPAAMRMTDGTLIVAGGLASLDASQPRGEVWALPPPGARSRTWTPRAAMHPPGAPATHGGCAYGVVLGRLVCAGGETAQAATTQVDSYDPYLDVWNHALEPMPVGRADVQGAAIGGRLYIPGGAAALASEPTDTLYVYAPLDTAPR